MRYFVFIHRKWNTNSYFIFSWHKIWKIIVFNSVLLISAYYPQLDIFFAVKGQITRISKKILLLLLVNLFKSAVSVLVFISELFFGNKSQFEFPFQRCCYYVPKLPELCAGSKLQKRPWRQRNGVSEVQRVKNDKHDKKNMSSNQCKFTIKSPKPVLWYHF